MATKRGWSSQGLKSVGDDPKLWTVSDASRLLGPPELTPAQVRNLVQMFRMKYDLEPMGKRRNATRGRYARVYRAESLIRAYNDLMAP